MGILDNIFGGNSSANPAVPGGNLAKPIIIALLALLAARAFGGSSKPAATAPAAPPPQPVPAPPNPPTPTVNASLPSGGQATSGSDLSLGGILGGLSEMFQNFQQAGQGDKMDSWIKEGPEKGISPGQLSNVLGPDTLRELSRRTGIPEDQLAEQLAKALPHVVDKLSPDGRLPTETELSRFLSA